MNTFIDKIMLYNIDGLRKLNSITKYPSILTYHNLGPKGSLVDSLVDGTGFDNRPVYITEKIDGTNSRVIFSTDSKGSVEDYIIGSREDFLFAKNDRIVNPALGIVKNMKPIADTICLLNEGTLKPNSIYCLYGETYGGKINGAKQYTSYGNSSIRIFDLWILEHNQVEELLNMEVEQISSWREHSGQPFVDVNTLQDFCDKFLLNTVPYIKTVNGNDIPERLQDVWNWMQVFSKSTACIDNGGLGNSEGIVIRYADRSLIRKIRFEDYLKTKRIGLIE